MPNLDDYHAFQSTSGGNGGSGGGGWGCSGSALIWILVILGALWIIGQLGG